MIKIDGVDPKMIANNLIPFEPTHPGEVLKAVSYTHLDVYKRQALYGIVDIKMRMLRIPELKKIMGFPEDYVLIGKMCIRDRMADANQDVRCKILG